MHSKTLDLDGKLRTTMLPILMDAQKRLLEFPRIFISSKYLQRFYFHSIEHEKIFFSSRHIIVYAPQTKSPTCFSSFPDNASELPNSCSQISRLE